MTTRTLHNQPGRITPQIAALFPPMVTVEVSGAEPGLIARASAQREEELLEGRACARRALARLGVEPGPLLRDARGAPQWPAGCCGSISHSRGVTIAVAARTRDVRALGVDVENVEPMDPRTSHLFCSPAETDWAEHAPGAPACGWLKVLFCAKEAAYKALNRDAASLTLRDLQITIAHDRRSFGIGPVSAPGGSPGGHEDVGRFAVLDGLLVTAVTLLD